MRNIKSIVEMVELVYDVRVDLRTVGNNSREGVGEGVGVGGNRGSQGFMFIWNNTNTNTNVNVVDNKAFNSYSM